MSIDQMIRPALLASVLLLGTLASARAAVPKIARVQVTESTMATQVEIVADAPVTYTYYMIHAPTRAVVDIALADPSPVARQLQVDSPLITGITIDRQETASIPLTRVTISLSQDAYLAVRSAPEDKGRLLVTLVKKIAAAPEPTAGVKQEQVVEQTGSLPDGHGAKAAPAEELNELTVEPATTPETSAAIPTTTAAAPTPPAAPVPVAAPTPAVTGKSPQDDNKRSGTTTPATLPAKTALKPVVPTAGAPKASSPITITATGVQISSSAPVNNPRVFRLTGPNRLVIDLPGAQNAFQKAEIPCNRFGINKVRVGIYPDKVRFVFDSGQSPTPTYRIEKSQSGLLVTFGK